MNAPAPQRSPGEQELKFLVPKDRSPAVRSWLDMTFQPHPSYAVCTICSIYFDTAELTSMTEKAESYFSKTKYRIRWYEDAVGEPLPVPAFMEIKEKHGKARHKYRAALPIHPRELLTTPLDAPFFDGLFREHCPKSAGAALPSSPLKPVLELRYVRHRYVHPVYEDAFCLDSEIRCTRTHPGILPSASGLLLAHDVFEQKGIHEDPLPVLRPLPRFDAQRTSVSKYYLSILQLQPNCPHT